MKASASYVGSSTLARDLRPALLAGERLAHLGELALHLVPELLRRLQDRLDDGRLGRLFLQLGADRVDLEPRELVELRLEDRLDLLLVEGEALHELAGGVGLSVGLADDADRLVERVVDDEEALEEVEAPLQLLEVEQEPPPDRLEPEVEEVPEDRGERKPRRLAHLGPGRRHEARQVHGHRRLERRVLVQVRHDERGVGLALDLEDDAHVLGGLVAHVDEGREPPLDDDVRDLRDESRLLLRVRDRRDDDRPGPAGALLDLPLAAQLQRALAALVDRAQLALAGDEEPARRKVRALDEAQRVRLAVVHGRDRGVEHLDGVVRRDRRRHADRDARRAVDEEVRVPRRQDHRLEVDAVEVRAPVDRLPADLGEELDRERAQARLGVAIGRRRVAVERAEVAVPVHERRAEREGLRHAHHRVVDRDVAVRVVLADDVAHDGRGLLELRVRRQVEVLEHREEDAALHGLEAVAHVRQRARRDDRERVVQVPAPGLLGKRDLGIERQRRLAARVGELSLRHGTTVPAPSGSVNPRSGTTSYPPGCLTHSGRAGTLPAVSS